jgi:D-alanyl-lipoteichoic acid acyltransferase DltB (MBOAT superfamily)
LLFNSIDFAVFLPLVFLFYWVVFKGQLKSQNLLLLISSYIFYGWWDYRFLTLILFSTSLDYFIGIALKKQIRQSRRFIFLLTSLFFNLSLLGFFKYYNFFVDNFVSAFTFFGSELRIDTLDIILPVGISFYTFQTLSYTIDIYKRKIEPTSSFIDFAVFVSFFPQLVAGPIERASHLLPQFRKEKFFDYNNCMDGLRQVLWGLFKKIVIADTCSVFVNMIFDNSSTYNGSTLFLGSILFSFQIYCDFSGYSDIAIGTARLFNYNLKTNFNFPYFSRDIAEFWRKWHISLSTWFRDYIYIPLGGSRVNQWLQVRNVFLIFLISGFWHGANWTFIIWGFINALFFLPYLLIKRNRNHIGVIAEYRVLPTLKEFCQILFTFLIITFTWVFFRAENIVHAFEMLKEIFSLTLFKNPSFGEGLTKLIPLFLFIVFLIVVEWKGRSYDYGLEWSKKSSPTFKWVFYFVIATLILEYSSLSNSQEFIYFDF